MLKRLVRIVSNQPRISRANRYVKSVGNLDDYTRNVPYQCQFPSENRVRDVLENNMPAGEDENWKTFGFDSRGEVSYWATRACGACCIKMVAEHRAEPLLLAEVIKSGVELGGYDVATDEGWYYKPLSNMAEMYGLSSRVEPYLPKNLLAQIVIEHNFVIASVNPQIIRGDSKITNTDKSGHLVVVLGVRVEQGRVQGFYIHNPSGKSAEMQHNAYIPVEVFDKAYGERGVVVSQVR